MWKSLLVRHTAEIIHKISSEQTRKENQIMFTQYNKGKQTIHSFGGDWEEGESGYCSDLWEERIGIADWNALNVLFAIGLKERRREDLVKVSVYLLCTRHWQIQMKDTSCQRSCHNRLYQKNSGRSARGSDKWEVQTQCEELVRVEGPPVLHSHQPRRPSAKSLEVKHRKWRRWTVPTGYYDLFFWY